MKAGERVYRALLLLLPSWLRRRYRDELLEAYRLDRRRERFRGPTGAARFWAHAVRDVVGTAVREWRDPSPVRTRERRGVRPGVWIVREARHAARGLRRAPGFAILATLTLGLGVGAVTTVFTVVDGVLLAPLPYPSSEELVRVWERDRDNPGDAMVAYGNWADVRRESDVFDELALWAYQAYTLTGPGDAVRVRGRRVSGNLARTLGVPAVMGRWITEEEARSDARSVVLGHALWRERFADDPGVLGRAIRLDGEPFTVVGVMPPGFDFPDGADLWVPLPPVTDPVGARRWHRHASVGRLAPGLDPTTAQTRLQPIFDRLEREHPDDNAGNFFELQPLRDSMVGSVRQGLTILLAACGLLLLIACVNLASLLLARTVARSRELATRAALGASRPQLGWFIAWESLFLAGAGSALGLGVAAVGSAIVRRSAAGIIPRMDEIGVGLPVLGVAVLAALVCALVVSLAPLLHRRSDTAAALRGGRSSSDPGAVRLRRRLVIGQLALAVVLVVGAGLLLRSLANLGAVDIGVHEETSIVTLEVQVPVPDPDPTDGAGAAGRAHALRVAGLLASLEAEPGVTRAAAVMTEPAYAYGWFNSLTIRDRPVPRAELPMIQYNIVTPGYFEVVGVALREGRWFDAADLSSDESVVIVNRAAAERHWPGESPVGKQILGSPETDQGWARVIGVVDDIRQDVSEPPRPEAFVPLEQEPMSMLLVVARVSGDPAGTARGLERIARAFDPNMPVSDVGTLDERIGATLSRPRFNTILMTVFAGLALLLACVGVYGVLAYMVAQRRREFGIRMAVGADRRSVLGFVLRDAAAIGLLATAIGLAGAVAVSRLIRGLLFGVTPADPVVLASVGALAFGVAVLAGLVPAWSATSVDPVAALREE